MISPELRDAATSIVDDIDRFIKWFNDDWRPGTLPARLSFSPELELAFGVENGPARTRELALTVPVASVLFILTAVTDPLFVPAIGMKGVAFRLLATPLFVVRSGPDPRTGTDKHLAGASGHPRGDRPFDDPGVDRGHIPILPGALFIRHDMSCPRLCQHDLSAAVQLRLRHDGDLLRRPVRFHLLPASHCPLVWASL